MTRRPGTKNSDSTVPSAGTIYEISAVELDGLQTKLPYGYDRGEGELTIRPSPLSVVRNGVRRGGGAVIESGELTVKATLQPTRTTAHCSRHLR